ncbi:MAG: hypothetical protein A2571_01110 [Candidatus Vogelbacteria bacterium RIFOXYD1_FULL_44_32]|uniref:HIT domain-containing protein n=1 Tax=Candidatus Vogelbacteria bacterium RIFOXYD1_FULL_44_32 TaxID=1802438 RepID=A0A1G2QEW0_9BACT|nr:MAG: hypothetical protein A2571_01110 [Candidatus Vogelbacteria bacterium RIFOXYD1_FULL_44_32]
MHVNINHGRPGQYEKLLGQIKNDGVCPFCQKNLPKYHKPPILKENGGWLVTINQNPYSGSKYHFLIIHKRHIENIKQIKTSEWSDLKKIIDWTTKKFAIPGGSFLLRFGDTEYTGASVTHLHCHIISGIKRNTNKKTISARVGYKK